MSYDHQSRVRKTRDSPRAGQVPAQLESKDVTRPGYLEGDSVAHCGTSLAGDFLWSLTCTDIATPWTEGRAVWNKGATGVLAATRAVEEELPFALLGFDCDNGSFVPQPPPPGLPA